jgi:hypothetical protein
MVGFWAWRIQRELFEEIRRLSRLVRYHAAQERVKVRDGLPTGVVPSREDLHSGQLWKEPEAYRTRLRSGPSRSTNRLGAQGNTSLDRNC